MPQSAKPGIDWNLIERHFRAGASSRSLAREFDVSRQAIDKRALKEGWKDAQNLSRLRAATVATIATERHPQDRFGQRSEAAITQALEMAEQGMPQTAIAAGCGMTASAFNHWMSDDPEFGIALREAWARHARARLTNVNDAAERGDARAAQWSLERNPITRDDMTPGRGNALGPNLIVHINVPRSLEQLEALVASQDHAGITTQDGGELLIPARTVGR